jgi:hypothetical protein
VCVRVCSALTGGCPKVQATPAKLTWARQIRHISASPTGQFAAAVDTAGKLYTWGAGVCASGLGLVPIQALHVVGRKQVQHTLC